MRQDPDFFGDIDLPLLYIAKKLKEALKVEQLLTSEGIDYLIETDTYRGGVIFVSERVGAFFYVHQEQLEAAQQVLSTHRYKPYEEG